jgi:hypothetical protein
VKILSAAESLEEARAAVHTSPTVSNREAMIRLLDAAEVRTSAAAIENIAWNVEDLWQRFRLATVLSDTVPDADYELEARAVLKASMRQIADHFSGQLAEARLQATEARDAAAKAADRYVRHARQAEERAEAALDGLVMQHLDLQMDPNGYYVYLLWGIEEDRPLYVGQSTNIFSRLGSHMNDPVKRARVRRVMVIGCKTERQMDSTELRLIRKYRPELNTAGVPRD